MEVISSVKLVSFFLCGESVFPGGKVFENKHKDGVSITDTGCAKCLYGFIYVCVGERADVFSIQTALLLLGSCADMISSGSGRWLQEEIGTTGRCLSLSCRAAGNQQTDNAGHRDRSASVQCKQPHTYIHIQTHRVTVDWQKILDSLGENKSLQRVKSELEK